MLNNPVRGFPRMSWCGCESMPQDDAGLLEVRTTYYADLGSPNLNPLPRRIFTITGWVKWNRRLQAVKPDLTHTLSMAVDIAQKCTRDA
ncbi:hypothetical protein FZEAL_9229 [Fusarium zealandicum]|uniref:Uncharacterized protein n=1 Tax=Fusarium zealandicum TaxID=1053134 RepID=A0A8H4UCW3_9HYPO|nr:hypothetical protein FZEAL_9229 [Fusarium zealandicum]